MTHIYIGSIRDITQYNMMYPFPKGKRASPEMVDALRGYRDPEGIVIHNMTNKELNYMMRDTLINLSANKIAVINYFVTTGGLFPSIRARYSVTIEDDHGLLRPRPEPTTIYPEQSTTRALSIHYGVAMHRWMDGYKHEWDMEWHREYQGYWPDAENEKNVSDVIDSMRYFKRAYR